MWSALTKHLRIKKLQVLTLIKLFDAKDTNNRVKVYRQYKLTLYLKKLLLHTLTDIRWTNFQTSQW